MLEISLDCFERAIEASVEDCHISERESREGWRWICSYEEEKTQGETLTWQVSRGKNRQARRSVTSQ